MPRADVWVDDPKRPGYEVTACRVTGKVHHMMSCYCRVRRRLKAPPSIIDPREKVVSRDES